MTDKAKISIIPYPQNDKTTKIISAEIMSMVSPLRNSLLSNAISPTNTPHPGIIKFRAISPFVALFNLIGTPFESVN